MLVMHKRSKLSFQIHMSIYNNFKCHKIGLCTKKFRQQLGKLHRCNPVPVLNNYSRQISGCYLKTQTSQCQLLSAPYDNHIVQRRHKLKKNPEPFSPSCWATYIHQKH